MDSVNRNSEKMQQQVSVPFSECHRLEPFPNRQPLVMIPTPRSIFTGEAQLKTSQSIVTGTSSLYHNDTVTSNSPPAVSNSLTLTNGANHNPMVSSSFGAQAIPAVTNSLALTNGANHNPMVSSSFGAQAIPAVSNSLALTNGANHSPMVSCSFGAQAIPAVSNSLALTNEANHNPMVSSSFGAQAIPAVIPTLSQPHTDQSLTCFNPYANQRLSSTSYGPQIDPKVNSISSRPQANWHDAFSIGKLEAVPLVSMSRPRDSWVDTSNNTNGIRFPVSAISPPTNAQTTGVGSISTAGVHGASTYPPIPRAPSQQDKVLTDAMTYPQQLPEQWSFRQPRIPSIYEEQLQKYLCHWSRRPKDNNITFWRQFVREYYAPDGKRKCCLSAWTDHITTKFRRWKDKSPCDHCRTYSQYGYDISCEELAIYFQYKFNSLRDETLKLGAFQELRLGNKNTVLYFSRVAQDSMDDHFWTVQEGPLAITFTTDKKILSWQFCVRHCEKLAPRSALLSGVSEMLRNSGDSSGASGSRSDQQWSKENSSMIIKKGCELAKKLKENQFYELDFSRQDVQTCMINNPPNTVKNSMDNNFRNQHVIESLQNCTTAQQSSGHQIQSQPMLSIISPSLGANKQQVNLWVPQFLHPTSVLDTSASSCRPVTCTESSSINSTVMTNPLCMASTVNATFLTGQSDPTVNLLKWAGTTENGLGTDALLEQRMTRQRLGETLSGNEVTTRSGDCNLTSTSDPTPSLFVDPNMGSSANLWHGSRVNPADWQVDHLFEGTDSDDYLSTDIAILEDLLKQ